MRTQVLFRTLITTIAAVFIGSVGLVASVYAAPGGGGGGGKGGGGGDAGEPPDYGDLVILYRDEYGVPHLTGDSCQQPLPSDECVAAAECPLVPGVTSSGPTDVLVIPVDGETCGIVDPACGSCTQEIEFGRANSARSPASVFEAQLEDVVVKLATADQIGLDAAGRLVACVDSGFDDEGTELPDTSSAVDSPLQNLAMYKQLMTYGYLGDGQITLPATALETAARGIGVAVDKGGKVSVDMVVYLNQIMGLSDLPSTILGEPICINVKEEVMGNIELVQRCFLNYGNVPGGGAFSYGRAGNFGSLPFPAYIPKGGPEEGWFEVLKWTEVDPDSPTFDIYRGPIFERVFGESGNGTANISGFVQEADDTREVINYMHSWPLPVAAIDPVTEDLVTFQTPVTCEGIEGDVDYDLSISADSGLQVPVQMVPIEEGREFIVTIANAGPDVASGSVWVSADTNSDTAVWKLQVYEDGELVLDAEGQPIREEAAPFEFAFDGLAAGSSKSWTTKFSVYPAVATKINWTATIVAEHDVNSTNNEVTETTNVRLTGKGGGKGGGGGGE